VPTSATPNFPVDQGVGNRSTWLLIATANYAA
jgi:hypothetical protein